MEELTIAQKIVNTERKLKWIEQLLDEFPQNRAKSIADHNNNPVNINNQIPRSIITLANYTDITHADDKLEDEKIRLHGIYKELLVKENNQNQVQQQGKYFIFC